MSQSKIFHKNRALGYVSDHIPLVTRFIERRKENLIVTSVGRAFHTYGCEHFTLLSVSGTHPGNITALAGDNYHVYTASEGQIFAWRRGNELKHTYNGHESPIHLLLPFGPHLISVDEDSVLKVWEIQSEIQVRERIFCKNVDKITTICHPATYINKIVIGTEQGHLHLWNLNTEKIIYTFNGWKSPVTALAQAPDGEGNILAIGLGDGRIKLHNLKTDCTLFELVQDYGHVTSISFRKDGAPIMATGSTQGHVVLWNLEERRVESQILKAHFGTVAGLQCLPCEPLMVTNSPDNSLKLWIFDLADGAARLLRIREGHSEPPTCIRFYGSDGHNILSAGGDSALRIFSTICETFNKSLGRASFNRKASKKKNRFVQDNLIMPPIVHLSAETTREKEWDNIAATHLGLGVVTTWSYDKTKMGEHKLLPKRLAKNYNAHATCIVLTRCGNFVVVGYSTGHIDRFNIQSGIHRATYGGEEGCHKGPVTGIAVDQLNQTVISAGKDGVLIFWHFSTAKGTEPIHRMSFLEAIDWIKAYRMNSLLAVAHADFTISLIDMQTRRQIRSFCGHSGPLTDACFSPDGRWLVSSSMDCTIRTWDVPSNKLVDVFRVPEACVSMDFSLNGTYLATSHVSQLGIYLWINKSLYKHISLKGISSSEPIPVVTLPGTQSEKNDNDESIEMDTDEQEDDVCASPDQLNECLITMSKLAISKWQNLLNIDIVKKRNKPKEAPKAPASAPFFLPTIPALEFQFDLSEAQPEEGDGKLLIPSNFSNLTSFGKFLKDTEDYPEVIRRLKQMGPSVIDIEIQSLSLDMDSTTEMLLKFMKLIKFMIDSRKDFELSQAYLAAFLKIHGSRIQEDKELVDFMDVVQEVQVSTWKTIREKLYHNISVVTYP